MYVIADCFSVDAIMVEDRSERLRQRLRKQDAWDHLQSDGNRSPEHCGIPKCSGSDLGYGELTSLKMLVHGAQ